MCLFGSFTYRLIHKGLVELSLAFLAGDVHLHVMSLQLRYMYICKPTHHIMYYISYNKFVQCVIHFRQSCLHGTRESGERTTVGEGHREALPCRTDIRTGGFPQSCVPFCAKVSALLPHTDAGQVLHIHCILFLLNCK